MRRFLIFLGLGTLLLPAFGGCGVTEEGGLKADSGAGATDGGGGLGGGQCFPGSKVCPDPDKPTELLCLTSDDPKLGCSQAASCEPCAVPHASPKCDSGSCAVDQCDNGWADCNNNPVDGCETDLTGDKNHCGDCATDCVASKGPGWICSAGVCEVNECCPTGATSCLTRRDCDGNKANGCEVDVATDVGNCKTCGNGCDLANAQEACSQEVCVVTTCVSGFANCDANDANGCETNINSGNKLNCGACGKACNENHASATCQGGSCKLACNPGWGNCNGNVDDGCETDTNTNPLHCGVCGKACNPLNVVTAQCVGGSCTYDVCKPGFTDCDGNKTNGCEVNTGQDKNNCGTCGNVCKAPSGGSVVCSNGACAESCGSGLTNCSGVCVNTSTDINYCGNCGTKCTPPANGNATCASGGCGFNCQNGFHKCGNECKANNDPTACGAACTNCPGPSSGSGNAICSAGTCNITCTAPTTLKCGSDCYNPTSDKNHCGGCSTVCTDPANGVNNCTASSCKITCNSGFHQCGAACKSDTDATACGTTCINCPGPSAGTGSATCVSGSCDFTCSAPTPDRCGSTCTDKQTDNKNCGTCGNDCTAQSKTCKTGNCVGTPTDGGAEGGDGG
ncbi:MAG: hypothetical protein HYZ29_13460 [Myxococcales bacterium]|nr:hypothetical protein [Myxococcales bacterium]